MSHRAVFSTKMNNAEIMAIALKDAGIAFRQDGSRFTLQTGAYDGTTVDCRTGQVVGADTDHKRDATDDAIGLLRQHYTVAERKEHHFKMGTSVSVESATVNGKQAVVLCCSREA
jgi:hypothetical protein